MQLNKLYVHKKEPTKVFEFEKMSAESAALKHTPFFGPPEVIQVPHEVLKEWKVCVILSFLSLITIFCCFLLITKLFPNGAHWHL